MSFRTHHGPSFQRLYADTPSRHLVEACEWYSNLDAVYPAPPAWADVVLDYRVARQSHSGMDGDRCRASGGSCDDGRNSPLPDVLGSPAQVWPSEMPGWALEGFVVRGVHRHTQVLRFTDPDGFRGAFVVSGTEDALALHAKGRSARGFETGRFTNLFPTASVDLLTAVQPAPGLMRSPLPPPTWAPLRDTSAQTGQAVLSAGATEAAEAGVRSSRVYSLPVLRDALRDPDGWFALTPDVVSGGWRNLTCGPSPARATWPVNTDDAAEDGAAAEFPDAMGADCPVSPDRVLLSYAMAGHTSYAPVAEFVAAGLDAAELARWRDSEVGKKNPSNYRIDPDTIIEWFAVVGGGGKARRQAIAFIATGVPPAKAHRWKALGDTPSSYADHIEGFEAAGWEPEDVRRIGSALAENSPSRGWTPPMNKASYKTVAQWLFTTAQAALDFHACGYTAAQAHALCEEAEDVELVRASVAAMANLRRPVVTAAPW